MRKPDVSLVLEVVVGERQEPAASDFGFIIHIIILGVGTEPLYKSGTSPPQTIYLWVPGSERQGRPKFPPNVVSFRSHFPLGMAVLPSTSKTDKISIWLWELILSICKY